jgi:glycosyltransferase involved in cell wall biosynthesis
MKIAIDLRSLQHGSISGVENYILNLLEHLIPADSSNSYTLFSNSYRAHDIGHLKFINTTTVSGRLPNRLLNLSLKLFKYPKFEKMFGDFDCLFLPNFNQFAINPRTKLVVTVHDMSPIVTPEFYDLRRRLWHRFVNIRKSLQRADRILAVSEFTKNELIRLYGLPSDKISVTHLAVNQRLFHPNLDIYKLRETRNVYGLPGKFFLYLGTLEPRKNIPSIIKAFESQNTDADLVIAGRPGWKYEPVFDLISKSPKRRQIKYIGYIEEGYKPALLKLAHALVWPSFYEGFGLPPLEAMAVGTPVITSQVASLPETVGDAALMINPYNIEDLANAMEAIEQEETRRQLIARGFDQVKKYSWDATAAKTLEAFKKL